MKCIFVVGLIFLFTEGPSGGVAAQTLVKITNCNVIGGKAEVTLIATLDESQSGTCTVNTLTQAIFKLKLADNTMTDLCTQDLTAPCSSTEQPGGCSCVSKSPSGVWTFHQKFTFNPATQTGAEIDLVPNCVPDTAYASRTKCTNFQSVDVCAGYDCNAGVCYEYNGTATCNCSNTYLTGPKCADNPCNITTSTCNNEGTKRCSPTYDGQFLCTCETGYYAPNCDFCYGIWHKDTCVHAIVAAAFALAFGIVSFLLGVCFAVLLRRYHKKRLNRQMLMDMGNEGECLLDHVSTCATCICNPSFAVPTGAANGGTEPTPDYDKSATNRGSTGHTATGSKKNGQGVTPL